MANRIANARFSIGAETFTLAATLGANTLHGGVKGFDRTWWRAERLPPTQGGMGEGVRLTYVSPDGEEGFPGTLTATVTYRVAAGGGGVGSSSSTGGGDGRKEVYDHDARLVTTMTATCDKVTP